MNFLEFKFRSITIVSFQGGIGPAGHSTDDLYVLDLTNDKFKWHRLVSEITFAYSYLFASIS